MWNIFFIFNGGPLSVCPATYPPLALAAAWSAKDPPAPLCVAAFPSQLKMGRWIPWFSKITGPPDETTGSVVGATPLARHHSGGVGLRSSCHLCVPLGGTVSTSQDALVSHYHQKRLLSTHSLLLLNRRWALTRFVDQSTELELLEKWFPPVFFCFIFLNWSLIGSLHCDIDWLVMLQPARVENCCQLRLNCPKSEAHSFTRFIFRNSS